MLTVKASAFTGQLRLVDACAQPGCPVCRCLTESSRHRLDALLYEQVTDLETRRRLRAAWGLCNWHTWMLLEIPGARASAAILYEDLMRRLVDHVRAAPPRRLARWFARWRARAAQGPAGLYRRRARCIACETADEAEHRYLESMLTAIDDMDFRAAYARSDGLCAPHTMRIMEIGPGHPGLAPLLESTLRAWVRIRGELASFIAKHDHRARDPFTVAEAVACQRALEVLSGAPGLFGNDLGRDHRA